MVNHFGNIRRGLMLLACLLTGYSGMSSASTEEVVGEKHEAVVMRLIGHEILMNIGDCESLVLPIEAQGDQYKISFEKTWSFDPSDVIAVTKSVMMESGIQRGVIVEVEQCLTGEIVHSFQINKPAETDLMPCQGRILPEDCYNVIVTLFDHLPQELNPELEMFEGSNGQDDQRKKPMQYALLMLPLLAIIGSVGYFIKRREISEKADTSILIGNTRFDEHGLLLIFDDNQIELSHKEATLFSLFVSHINQTLERELILNKVWGDEGDYVGRTLDVFISKLRKKLEADESIKIITIRGVGYKLTAPAVS